jgi:D-amino peptidase
LREYTSIRLNGQIVGEIAIEAALAATRGVPLLFVSGDSCGCAEAAAQFPDAVTVAVKEALGDAAALCYPPARTARLLAEGARRAARLAGAVSCMPVQTPVTLSVTFSQCPYLEVMRRQHPALFVSSTCLEMTGSDLLALWAQYLTYEREMIAG